MNTDLAIAQAATTRPIVEVAADLGLMLDDLELYGANKAKIAFPTLNRILNDDTRTERQDRGGDGDHADAGG